MPLIVIVSMMTIFVGWLFSMITTGVFFVVTRTVIRRASMLMMLRSAAL